MNAVLYARVSTEKQADKDLSIPAQLQAMRDYASHRSWTVVEEFIEPGASAKTTERPALQRLLIAIKDSNLEVGVVLVHKIDRLARNVYDHAMLRALFTQRDVRLASVVENMDDSVSGQLVENIMASIAQFYSANLADEVRKGMRQKVLTGGWPHQAPRGYVVSRIGTGRESVIEIHPREGALMRGAFELYATGAYSLKALARRLATDGLTARNGRPFAVSYLNRLLTNPFYTGRLQWGDLNVQGKHQPLVTSAVFEQVQKTMEQRHRNPGVKGSVEGFPLRGVGICSSCRGRMTAERHSRWGYYRCGRNAFKSQACRAKFCNAERAHLDLERLCQQIRLSRPIIDSIMKAAQRLIDSRAKAIGPARLASDREDASVLREEMALTDAFTADDVPPHVYKAKMEQLRARRTAANKVMVRATVDPAELAARVGRTLHIANSMWDLYDSLSDPKRAELIRQVFRTIVLSADGIIGFTLKPPFDTLISAAKNDPRKLSGRASAAVAEALVNAA
ncbi:MAG: recombinase family protein [Hyphomicrobium sp.]|jgi:DNA invertase Pin-like site-specific DNA recombinase